MVVMCNCNLRLSRAQLTKMKTKTASKTRENGHRKRTVNSPIAWRTPGQCACFSPCFLCYIRQADRSYPTLSRAKTGWKRLDAIQVRLLWPACLPHAASCILRHVSRFSEIYFRCRKVSMQRKATRVTIWASVCTSKVELAFITFDDLTNHERQL